MNAHERTATAAESNIRELTATELEEVSGGFWGSAWWHFGVGVAIGYAIADALD